MSLFEDCLIDSYLYRLYRPQCSAASDPIGWWRYAISATIYQIKQRKKRDDVRSKSILSISENISKVESELHPELSDIEMLKIENQSLKVIIASLNNKTSSRSPLSRSSVNSQNSTIISPSMDNDSVGSVESSKSKFVIPIRPVVTISEKKPAPRIVYAGSRPKVVKQTNQTFSSDKKPMSKQIGTVNSARAAKTSYASNDNSEVVDVSQISSFTTPDSIDLLDVISDTTEDKKSKLTGTSRKSRVIATLTSRSNQDVPQRSKLKKTKNEHGKAASAAKLPEDRPNPDTKTKTSDSPKTQKSRFERLFDEARRVYLNKLPLILWSPDEDKKSKTSSPG